MFRRFSVVTTLTTLLFSCGGTVGTQVALTPQSVAPAATTTIVLTAPHRMQELNVWAAGNLAVLRQQKIDQLVKIQQLEMAAAFIAASRKATTVDPPVHVLEPPPTTIIIGSASSVAQCIKDHESGNYAESSHPGSGSGAYQYVPDTWRHYFNLWKASLPPAQQLMIPYYDLAYQAPPWVQDAVFQYTLSHGGAGNWSPRYGNDPCTVGMGG